MLRMSGTISQHPPYSTLEFHTIYSTTSMYNIIIIHVTFNEISSPESLGNISSVVEVVYRMVEVHFFWFTITDTQ